MSVVMPCSAGIFSLQPFGAPPKILASQKATYDQFDKQNLFEDSHWLIFTHGLVPANIVVAWAAWGGGACIYGPVCAKYIIGLAMSCPLSCHVALWIDFRPQ